MIHPSVKVHPPVDICDADIGEGSEIFRYCIIGARPFFYRYKLTRLFPVQIGKNVTIHGLSSVDLGVQKPTIIGDNVKIDTHCHIGHDSVIGEGSVIACGFTGGGFITMGKNVRIGLGVTIANRVEIADNTFIGQGAVINSNVSGIVIPQQHNLDPRLADRLMEVRKRRIDRAQNGQG